MGENGRNRIKRIRMAVWLITLALVSGNVPLSVSAQEIPVPAVKNWKRCSDKSMELTWEQSPGADGYQIQYSPNRTFASVKTVIVNNGETTEKKIQGLKKNHTYYARIRAFRSPENEISHSEWSVTGNIKENTKIQYRQVKDKNSVLELRRCAGEEAGQCDTVKGACTDGTCAYYLMASESTGKCKILKVSIDTGSRVGISDSLNIQDGSDMTYDSERGQIALCHGSLGEGNQVSYIDPGTLKIISKKTIRLPDKLNGSSGSDGGSVFGFNGIAYSAARKEYVAMIDGSHHLLILDKKMEPVKMVKTSKDNSYRFQGIDATDDYILTCMSPDNKKQKCSRITIYDWDGNRISTINVKNGCELESIYHVGNQFYATFLCEHYQNLYKTVEKRVRIDGKAVIKKVKKKIRVLKKNNFVYQLGF